MDAKSRAEFYRQRATHCKRMAETMADQDALFKFLKAAVEWRKVAQQVEELSKRRAGGWRPPPSND